MNLDPATDGVGMERWIGRLECLDIDGSLERIDRNNMVKLNPGLIAVLLWSLASSVIWSFVNALYIRLIESAANERFLIIDVVDLFMIVAAKIEPLAAPAINIIFVAALSDADERLLAGPGLAIGTAFGALASLYLVACSAAKAIVTFLNGPNLHNSLRRFRLAIYVAEIALCLERRAVRLNREGFP